MQAHFAPVPSWAPRASLTIPPRILISDIQKAVARHYDIPLAEMTSARRARRIARPRQVAMYLAKRLTPRSMPEIGRRFGNRDHTTVIHGVFVTGERMQTDPDLARDIQILTAQLAPHAASPSPAQGGN